MAFRSVERKPVSLRSFLSGAVFVGAEDIVAQDCQKTPSKCREGSVLVVGVDAAIPEMEQVDRAMKQGAIGVITESLLPCSVPQCLVPDARIAFASLAMELAGNPCEDLLTIGVMGTHGKTTVSLLISAMLKRLGGKVAYRTSLGCSNGNRSQTRFQQDGTASQLSRWLTSSLEQQSPAAVLEISDSMLLNRAVSGMAYDVLVIPSMRMPQRWTRLEARGLETAMLGVCDQLKKHGLVIYNADDARLNQWIEKHRIPAIGYGLDADAEVRGKRLSREIGHQSLMVSAGHQLMPVNTPLVGDHHARHVLGAIATGYAFGLELHEVIGGVERMTKIPGRMQSVVRGQPFSVYVDAAEQADRLAVALHALTTQSAGRVVCVAEVPEGTDAEGRAAYGRVLERAASKVILTHSRRSRGAGQSEMWEVLDGCEVPAKIDLIPNRATAIELALRSAGAGDQVLLAGWGADSWTSGADRTVQTDHEFAEKILEKLEDSSGNPSVAYSIFP